MLKKIANAVGAIVAVFLIVGALLPGRYTVERSIEIAKPPAVVDRQEHAPVTEEMPPPATVSEEKPSLEGARGRRPFPDRRRG